jgi:type III secretory pathway component EscR
LCRPVIEEFINEFLNKVEVANENLAKSFKDFLKWTLIDANKVELFNEEKFKQMEKEYRDMTKNDDFHLSFYASEFAHVAQRWVPRGIFLV